MNNFTKSYKVTIQSIQFTNFTEMYLKMAQYWNQCGGTIIRSMTPVYEVLWIGDEYTLAQFKLIQPDNNVIITFTEIMKNEKI